MTTKIMETESLSDIKIRHSVWFAEEDNRDIGRILSFDSDDFYIEFKGKFELGTYVDGKLVFSADFLEDLWSKISTKSRRIIAPKTYEPHLVCGPKRDVVGKLFHVRCKI